MFWSLTPRELAKAFLPVTVAAELEFDSVSPPPDTIEEEDEGQLPINCDKPQHPTSLLKQLKTGNKLEGRKTLLANGKKLSLINKPITAKTTLIVRLWD